MSFRSTATFCAIAFAASGCARPPSGPAVLALPAPGKPFTQFQTEDTSLS